MKSLLSTYGVQEPSAGFDDKVMQLLDTPVAAHAVVFLKPLVLRILLGIFIAACVALSVIAFFVNPQIFNNYITVSLPSSVYTQLFSFLAAFWIVMLANLWWNKRKAAITN